MKNEEAKTNLEKLSHLSDDGMIDFSIIRESVKVAIEALEKQIPKIIISKDDYEDCPTCGRIVRYQSEGYCNDCGQKYEWRNE